LVAVIIPAVLFTLHCQFRALCILYPDARMSVRSQLETECQKEFNNVLNSSTKSVRDNASKALIIDVISG